MKIKKTQIFSKTTWPLLFLLVFNFWSCNPFHKNQDNNQQIKKNKKAIVTGPQITNTEDEQEERLEVVEEEGFVKVKGQHFELAGKPYFYLGTNFWYGMNLGSKGAGGDRERLLRELNQLKLIGVKNLRIMAGSEGPDSEPYRMVPSMQPAPGIYNPDILEGLDFLLVEMKKRGMKGVLCLNNFWNWSGGMSQYIAWSGAKKTIPYPPPHPGGTWLVYQLFVEKFYQNEKAKELFNNHLRFIINRENSISKIAYKNDSTIMSWELANEPRGITKTKYFRNWIHETAALIKSIDPNHLVTVGSEGSTSSNFAGTDLILDHQSPFVDYATIHLWVQNWGIYDPEDVEGTFSRSITYAKKYLEKHEQQAITLGKPLVLEEFGISRDGNNHQAETPVIVRDQYYKILFEEAFKLAKKSKSAMSGVNFWAWGGEGRPKKPGDLWKVGDDFIGDPAHETQGWYSVFNNDYSTLEIISTYTKLFDELGYSTIIIKE